ncbi:MAG: DUF393 domain-containing protein [Chloroflexi bacterium]|jgi:predicted DCC family thiol-disulfide oxidoreductase YuxK|nr:DUF393 domain-containing protein [Chloroflexota bacterium]MBT3669749.1 DUF393 domain-containing protein [Chloroflexota bacterium]MBT4002877.1 DUF393 domain-containing protein [Chloroflexota bacterium]MBT4305229.1 DUF393 domain-containing protein [Chloroflexota bacterium]MBT4534848.1 DUF393 domain-containing protein [Chloroflexota bacterium]
MTDHIPLVLFDGVCNLCNATVVFLLRWEAQPVLKFANLQSDFGKKVLERYSLSSEAMDTVILVEDGQIYTRSKAAIKLLDYLKFPWQILKIFSIIPIALGDRIYNWIAHNRYTWFGKSDQCAIPSPLIQTRFLS